MSLCIMWGMLLSILFSKRYLKKLGAPAPPAAGPRPASATAP